MKLASEWKEYKILDMAEGQKLERWGDVILARPDPQIIWKDKSYPKNGKKLMQHTIEVKLVEEHGNLIKRFQNNGKYIIKI